MIKLKTGVSTSLDFVKVLKERGQEVSPAFPAKTLRKQLDDLSEDVKVTFKSNNETILQVVNDYEEPKETFELTLKYASTPNQYGVYPLLLQPEDIEFNTEMVTVEDGFIFPGEHSVVKVGSTLIPEGEYSLDAETQTLVLGGDTFTQIFTENGNTLVGLTFDIHIDAEIGTKDDEVSAEFNKVFVYGETVDGSEYPGELPTTGE